MKKYIFHKRLSAFVLCLWQMTLLFAQDGTIKGRVLNGNEDLPSATVSLGNQTILTNNKGEFSLSVKTGSYTLTITHAGYEKIQRAIKVGAGNTQILNLIMIPVEQLGQVVILGSRSTIERSNLNTPVPVDVFSSKALLQTGQISLTQMLNIAAPSFNSSRELLNEPVTLRGLDPQHVLILLNGTRYHNMAWFYGGGLRGQLGRGSAGNDLNSIPFSAVEKVEVLRDGASAQYGSDAVAGVINIRLKESTGKTSIRFHTGQYYKSDGEKFSIGINHGLAFGNSRQGFLIFSADYRYQEPTLRGGVYQGTVYRNYPAGASSYDSAVIKAIDDSIVIARGFNRKSVIDNVGALKIRSGGFLVNGGYSISKYTKIFLTATANERKVWRDNAYRFPKNPNQVNLALYPDGFQAKSNPKTNDISTIAGIKGETKNNQYWEVSTSYGRNAVIAGVTNSNNASQSFMGKDAPTSFYTGRQVYQQLTNNFHLSKKYASQVKSLNVAAGGEWRIENYYNAAGDSASWYNYDQSGRTQSGAGGIRPENVINKSRNVLGTYFDIEADLNNRFLVDAAGRYEYYSDFGGNLAGKLALRYKLSERLMLRASINNGFRAPSLQQRYHTSTQNGFIRMGGTLFAPTVNGTFPNNHEVTKALGIPSLTAERTINVSGGLTAKVDNRISLTVDAYWIQIKNRIILSNAYNRRDNKSVDSILSLYPDLNEIDQVSFFSNAINTITYGIDLVLNGFHSFHKSKLHYTFAANFNRTRLFGKIQSPNNLPGNAVNTNILFNRADSASAEKGQPQDKITLRLNYQIRKVEFILTNTRYGTTTVFHETTPALDETFSPKVLTDISIQYRVKPWMTITTGANNVFDIYPDRLNYYSNTNQGLFIYSPEASPFGFNGGYYFLSMSFNF